VRTGGASKESQTTTDWGGGAFRVSTKGDIGYACRKAPRPDVCAWISRSGGGSEYAESMRFSFSGRAFVVAIASSIALAAGCSSAPPVAQAFVQVTLSPTSGGSCVGVGATTTIVSIGTPAAVGSNNPTRVPDGGTVHISCSVKGSSPNFSISLSARSDSTVTGGSLSITGAGITSDSGNNAGGMNLNGIFVGTAGYGEYSASDCTLTYSYNNAPNVGGIAPGRIWGHVNCVGALNESSMPPSSCNVDADFVFENCGS
jgi:hypothetical protein